MLLGKDVSTLLNCKTGKLACSSRNINGAFHLFHTSCLIRWALLCVFETWSSHSINLKTTTLGRKSKLSQKRFLYFALSVKVQVYMLREMKGTVPLSEIVLHKLKVIEAYKARMTNPEDLENCSTGLHFSSDPSEKPHVTENLICA